VAHPSDPAFLVLHALRLKGFAEGDVVAAATGLGSDEVDRHLSSLAGDELVVRRDGRVAGWALTPAGRTRHVDLVAAELAESGARDDVKSGYERFLEINHEMLSVCTAWQLRETEGAQAINDHSDAAYDAGVIQRLLGIHDRVRPVTADLRDALQRFSGYGERLRGALEKVVGGEHDWFTKPVIDSYHTVWFELHEDLLCTLGLERSSESHG
jgi:hypothetical protein